MEKGAIIKHNKDNAPKTGDWRYMKPEVDVSKCIGCGTCVKYCPEAVMKIVTSDKEQAAEELDKARKFASIDYEYCKGCGVCAQICPFKAISMRK